MQRRRKMLEFDQSRIWADLEARLARTENPRHRRLLETVIAHGKAEAALDIEGLMATLVPDPRYHFWNNGLDRGPKGYDGVRAYYEAFAKGGGAVFESPKERICVDDRMIVHEGVMRNLIPGSLAKARGYNVPSEDGHYLVRFRSVILWEFDDEGRAIGEDSYSSLDPDAFERVDDADLPAVYVDYLRSIGMLDAATTATA
jgi:hypothetical protein